MLQPTSPKNDQLQVYVNGELMPRNEARISVFDSVVQGGDAVWEGLRLYPNGILFLEKHLERLQHSAHALLFKNVPSNDRIRQAIRQTLEANDMHDQVHIRLTLTRGEKVTSGMDPRLNQHGCGLIVLAEWKPLVYDNEMGIRVITSNVQRNGPQYLDSKIHHTNLLNNILAKIQANNAGVDASIMLDNRGFIAELNDTNLFFIIDDTVITPRDTAALPGITRNTLLDCCAKIKQPCHEQDISLTQAYNADFAFATGTMGQLTPVVEADGRSIGNGRGRALFEKLSAAYDNYKMNYCSTP